MKIQELIRLLENQLISLNSARTTAFILGDIASVLDIDNKIEETEQTLAALKGI